MYAFFTSCDRRTGDLLVKLAETRVDGLVAAGRANSFAPAGRRFREWAAIPETRSRGIADRELECAGQEEDEEAVIAFTGFPAAAWEFLDGLAAETRALLLLRGRRRNSAPAPC